MSEPLHHRFEESDVACERDERVEPLRLEKRAE